MLEENLHETHSEFEKLRTELNEKMSQLSQCSEQKMYLESKLQAEKKNSEQSALQRKALQVISPCQGTISWAKYREFIILCK